MGLLLWTSRWGLAAIYAYPAQMLIDYWSKQKQGEQSLSQERWQSAYDALNKARTILPHDAHLHLLAGQMHHYQAISRAGWTEASKIHWQEAIHAYRTALRQRPMWGYVWGVLTQAQLQSAAQTALVLADWHRTLHFAPNSFDTYQVTLQVGFAYWSTLQDQERMVVKQAIAQLFPEQGDRVIHLASKFKLLELLQPYLQQYPQWQKPFKAAQEAG
ncbi:hypothetical protein [Candidatus Magnetaquicoccus inordinatus]|uniref:hypothetical protein n=1 Tax=Candidatus Magnetaquicoccus inordinatus TaxID=2496818 RepID=UPI001D0F360C|nr:hypothetical protein [Candidatus Magnetaquicoccus inordinatus]